MVDIEDSARIYGLENRNNENNKKTFMSEQLIIVYNRPSVEFTDTALSRVKSVNWSNTNPEIAKNKKN